MGRLLSSKSGSGRNSEHVSDKFMRCSRCGHWLDYTKHQKGNDGQTLGWGIDYQAQDSIYDPVVQNGCPQCGTLRYHK